MVWDSEVPRTHICGNAAAAWANGYSDGNFKISYSYGMNFTDWGDPLDKSLWYPGFPAATPPIPPQPAISYKFSRVRKPSNKIAWADSLGYWIQRSASGQYIGETTSGGTRTAYRHNGGANVVFFDGHGEWMNRKRVDITYLTTAAADAIWYVYR